MGPVSTSADAAGLAVLPVKATRTVTVGLLKTGLLCNQGQDHVGVELP